MKILALLFLAVAVTARPQVGQPNNEVPEVDHPDYPDPPEGKGRQRASRQDYYAYGGNQNPGYGFENSGAQDAAPQGEQYYPQQQQQYQYQYQPQQVQQDQDY